MTKTFDWYLGIDWGSETHYWCLLDAQGQVRGERTVGHSADAVHDAVQWVHALTGVAPHETAVAIETPHGALVDTLLDQGLCVFAINPKQLDRFRDRFSTGGAKDDRRDAHVAADALRTDQRAFRRVSSDDPVIIQLRDVSRLLDDLRVEEGRLANQLREQLYRVDAAWLTLSPAADDPWLWTILRATPHPAAWRSLARRRIASALRAHRIRRLTIDEVVRVVQQPRLTVAPGVPDAVAIRITALIPQLLVVHEQRTLAVHQTDRLLQQLASRVEAPEGEGREHRDVEILQSLPGVGRIVAATMLTEAAGPLTDRDYLTLRTYAGTAPVTKRSGKRGFFVHMRYACKRRLRSALYHWSRTSIQCDAGARAYYDRLRARGHGHARALRSVADRWLRILVAMLRTGTLYDPARFPSAVEITA